MSYLQDVLANNTLPMKPVGGEAYFARNNNTIATEGIK